MVTHIAECIYHNHDAISESFIEISNTGKIGWQVTVLTVHKYMQWLSESGLRVRRPVSCYIWYNTVTLFL